MQIQNDQLCEDILRRWKVLELAKQSFGFIEELSTLDRKTEPELVENEFQLGVLYNAALRQGVSDLAKLFCNPTNQSLNVWVLIDSFRKGGKYAGVSIGNEIEKLIPAVKKHLQKHASIIEELLLQMDRIPHKMDGSEIAVIEIANFCTGALEPILAHLALRFINEEWAMIREFGYPNFITKH